MSYYGRAVSRLIEEFSKLPGVGQKSAGRMAFYVLKLPEEKAESLANAILDARRQAKHCKLCQNLTEDEICSICANTERDNTTIMVVETPQDMAAYEKTREYRGLYHILHGAISPLDGISPGEIRIKELVARLNSDDITELILATNPTVEGEATAMYIAKLLNGFGIQITRIAHGVPIGGGLEYIDPITLLRALEGRRKI